MENNNGNQNHRYKILKISAIAAYIIYLLVICAYSYHKPGYNADVLFYMGVILSYRDEEHVFKKVHAAAKEEIPEDIYRRLTTEAGNSKAVQDSAEFNLNMPFYIVKPLYTGIGSLLYKAGIPLSKATVLPSVAAYFFICILMVWWLHKYLSLLFAIAISCFVAIWSPLLTASKLSTPDCLSAFLLFSSIYFFAERKPLVFSYLFLLLSILTRIDNIIPAFFILSLLLTNKFFKKISLKKYSVLIAGVVVCYLAAVYGTKEYGWSVAYYPTFYRHMNLNHDIHEAFSFGGYVALVKSQLMTGLYFSNVVVFFILSSFLFLQKQTISLKRLNRQQILVVVFIVVIITRFMLQPVIADRFYLAYYLCVIVFCIGQLRVRSEGSVVRGEL